MLSFCLWFLKFSHKTLLCYIIILTTIKEHWLSVILPTFSSVKLYVTAFHCNHIYIDQPHWSTLDLVFLCLFVCFYLLLFHIFLNRAKTKKQKKINESDKLRQKIKESKQFPHQTFIMQSENSDLNFRFCIRFSYYKTYVLRHVFHYKTGNFITFYKDVICFCFCVTKSQR